MSEDKLPTDAKPSSNTALGDLSKPIFDDSAFGKSMKEYYAAKARTLEAWIAKIKADTGTPSVQGEKEG